MNSNSNEKLSSTVEKELGRIASQMTRLELDEYLHAVSHIYLARGDSAISDALHLLIYAMRFGVVNELLADMVASAERHNLPGMADEALNFIPIAEDDPLLN